MSEPAFWASLSAAVGSLIHGYGLASTNSAVNPLMIFLGVCEGEEEPWMNSLGDCPAYITCPNARMHTSLLTSASLLTGTIAIFISSFAVVLGRRKLLLAGFSIALVGLSLASGSVNLWMLLGSRYIYGAAMGMFAFTVPLWISEVAPADRRGRFASMVELGISFGILYVGLASLGFSGAPALPKDHTALCGENDSIYDRSDCGGQTDGQYFCAYRQDFDGLWWRFVVGILSLPIAIVGLILFLFKWRRDTPVLYLQKGQKDEASNALIEYRGKEAIETELAEMAARVAAAKEENSSGGLAACQALFATRKRIQAFAASLLLALAQPLTGTSAFSVLSTFLFLEAGLSPQTAQVLNVVICLIKIGMSFIAMMLVDRWGRKPLLLMGLAFQFFALAPAAISHLVDPTSTTSTALAIVGALLFHVGFSLGLGPVVFMYLFEAHPAATRSMAARISTTSNWLGNLVVFFTAPLMSTTLTFNLYCGLSALAFIGVWFLVLETKGLPIGVSPYEPPEHTGDEETAEASPAKSAADSASGEE